MDYTKANARVTLYVIGNLEPSEANSFKMHIQVSVVYGEFQQATGANFKHPVYLY